MNLVSVQIVECLSNEPPGFVAAQLADAYGEKHTFYDKAPVFGCDPFDDDFALPVAGWLGCEVVERFREAGRDLATIDTERPWDIESTKGHYRFVVEAEAVAEDS